ncbi:ribbon-helix-helix domain-containing protein [Paenibacillus tundrae]|uniref:ribbon-helix-helix domain-containing protein n=1 Tax=Paenibacillus tundrae TaxID=528187 RepID=UPI0027D8D1E6|nr:ribbon-helix-helix domain-containing protein [Paenibacillus tundrae]
MNKHQKIQFSQMVERSVEQATKNLSGTKGVVSVRLSQEEIDVIDQLVFLELAKNRSDATAMLIREGIRTHESLFNEMREYTAELEQVKAKMQRRIQESGLVGRLQQADDREEIPNGGDGHESKSND